MKAKAQWAEEHGFVWFSVMDHMIQIPRVGTPDEPVLEGWTVLAGLAAVTSRIRLATLCTAVGYRNPAHLTKIAASVDLISRGRLTLGIGAGFLEGEYRQYGWEFPPRPATRIRQMEEAVQLILKMWTEPRTRLLKEKAAARHHLAPRGTRRVPCPAAQDPCQMLPPPEASETLHAPFACHLWDSRPHPWSDKAFMSPMHQAAAIARRSSRR